jgi:hypothetical protein
VLTLSEGIGDKREMNRAKEHYVELFKAGKDAAEAFEPPEEALDFIASLVESAVVFPGFDPIRFGWDDGNHAQVKDKLSGLIVLVGSIHQHRQAFRRPFESS